MVDEKDNLEEFEEEPVIVMTDEEGNEFYYREDMIIPIGDKKFAILVSLEDECECGDPDCDCEDIDVFIARIETDEHGEDIYVDPTDEEFEQVRQAYEDLLSEEDED